MQIKEILDNLVFQFETEDFIQDDPIQFPHRFKTKTDIEISGFIASLFAYGKRELFINKLNTLFCYFDNSPFLFLETSTNISSVINIDYRFSKNIDIVQILEKLHFLYYKDNSTLEELFFNGWKQSHDIYKMLEFVMDYFYTDITKDITNGYFHLLPNPKNNSSMKRMNMFLRWMVRSGVVDFGLWNFLPKSELLIPLDVHVGNISRRLNLLDTKSNDSKAVKYLTAQLKKFDSDDPVKYDFALFGLGVSKNISCVELV